MRRHTQSQNLYSPSCRQFCRQNRYRSCAHHQVLRQNGTGLSRRRVSAESVAFTSTHSFMLDVPVLLLTLDGAVARIPATVIHCFLLAVVALTHRQQSHIKPLSHEQTHDVTVIQPVIHSSIKQKLEFSKFHSSKIESFHRIYDKHHFYQDHNQSDNSLTHCFFLVAEISVLCFCTTFFNSSANSSLYRSSACRRALSTSCCACASARDSAFCLSSSKSLRNCTRHVMHDSSKTSNTTESTGKKQQS